jgi:hypothetical protein
MIAGGLPHAHTVCQSRGQEEYERRRWSMPGRPSLARSFGRGRASEGIHHDVEVYCSTFRNEPDVRQMGLLDI